jgi:hypothetical protein
MPAPVTPPPRGLAWIGLAGLLACSRAGSDPPAAGPTRVPAAPVAAAPSPAVAAAPAVAAPAPTVEDVPKDSPPPGPPTPLSEEAAKVFLGTAEDVAPVELGGVTDLRKGQHYVSSNERNLEAFHPRIAGLGGAYLGVGTDQGYLMIGWTRAELAWLIDYDPVVLDIHAIYHALLGEAETPEAFLELWRKEHKPRAIAALHARYTPRDARRRELLYRRYRAQIARRLDLLRTTTAAAAVATFLSDAAQYAHVRELVRGRRVRALLADLTREGALRDIGEAARALAVPIRVIYFSNAEEYWQTLPEAFRGNVLALPVDERSVVLRTLLTWSKNQDYRYNAQPARNYQQWLAQPWVRSIYDVVRRRNFDPAEVHFFETDEVPDEAEFRRKQERRALAQARAGSP